jgi:hypothetical protein
MRMLPAKERSALLNPIQTRPFHHVNVDNASASHSASVTDPISSGFHNSSLTPISRK